MFVISPLKCVPKNCSSFVIHFCVSFFAEDVTELTLTIGSKMVTPEDKDLTVNIPAIGQSVKCKAKGSNPKPMLHIYLDGKDMQKEWNLQDISNFNEVVSGAKAGVRSHTTELVAEEGTLLRKSDESKLIKCTAEVPGSDFPRKTVEAHITVACMFSFLLCIFLTCWHSLIFFKLRRQ